MCVFSPKLCNSKHITPERMLLDFEVQGEKGDDNLFQINFYFAVPNLSLHPFFFF